MSISHFRDREKPSILTASDQNRRFFASRAPRAGGRAPERGPGQGPWSPERGRNAVARGGRLRSEVGAPSQRGTTPGRSRYAVAGGVTDCGRHTAASYQSRPARRARPARRGCAAPPPSNAIGPRRLPGPDLLHAALSYAMMLACLLVCLLARWSPTYLTSWIFSMSSRVVSR